MSKRLRLWFCGLALVVLALVVAVIAIGGRPDPLGPAVALDGAWRFHPGDNPAWADPRLDERDWDRLTLVSSPDNRDDDVGLPGWLAGWHAHGHPKLQGYGWYRREVALPARGELVLLGPTMVDDGYEMFWNGRPLGGIGRLGADPKVIGARPYLVRLPRVEGERSGTLAIRAYMIPGLGRDGVSGGLRSVPTLATADFGARLHHAQWMRTIAGYIVEVAIPAMMILLAGIALAVARSNGRPVFARWLALALVATALLRLGNAVAAWTDLLGAFTLGYGNAYVLSPLAMLAWTAAWNAWTDGRERRAVLTSALAAWVARIVGAAFHLSTLVTGARMVFILLFAVIALRIVRHGERKGLALTAMLSIAVALFAGELSQLGVPTIWFPNNIGVTLGQYIYGVVVFVLPFLLVRRDPDRTAPADR